MPISFFLNNELRGIKKKRELLDRIRILAYIEQRVIGNLAVVLMSDKELIQYNKKHLKHNYYTDIITFDYSNNEVISGDLLISVDRVSDNAKIFKVPFHNELHRVILHGILHLCGYKDKSKNDIKQMRQKENFYLNIELN